MTIRVTNDEPSSEDRLQRRPYVDALRRVVEQCETPLVVGLYGTWGVGKTSLMRQLQAELDVSGLCLTVWFDAWQHQFDDDPSVALLHTMVDALGLGDEGRRLLKVISSALGSLVLRATTTLSSTEVHEITERYDEERFRLREKQIKLRRYFDELLDRATNGGEIRLVFFIDDLDRCIPEHVLKVLEALKLFLNNPGCVYVLGVDRAALEASIRFSYGQSDLSEADYLDKIVQLPFSIPPIAERSLQAFVESLLPDDLAQVADLLVENLGGNPRQVKRFVNSMILNHRLASELIGERYQPRTLAAVLMIQYLDPTLFKRATADLSVLSPESSEGNENPVVSRLKGVIGSNHFGHLPQYVFLSELASSRTLTFNVVLEDSGPQKIQVIKVVRELTLMGLKEAKDLTDAAPSIVSSYPTRAEADQAVNLLLEAGASASIQ
jgi:ribosomal protein L7/L12